MKNTNIAIAANQINVVDPDKHWITVLDQWKTRKKERVVSPVDAIRDVGFGTVLIDQGQQQSQDFRPDSIRSAAGKNATIFYISTRLMTHGELEAAAQAEVVVIHRPIAAKVLVAILDSISIEQESTGPFRTCSGCNQVWATREDLMNERELEFTGFQTFPAMPEKGLFLLTHIRKSCNSTFSVPIVRMVDLPGDLNNRPLNWRKQGCGGHCGRISDLSGCDAPCRNAPARQVAAALRNLLNRGVA